MGIQDILISWEICVPSTHSSPEVFSYEYILFFGFLFIGTKIEKRLYSNCTLTDLVQRLLEKRCVAFVGSADSYLLISKIDGDGGFEKIGTDIEKKPLILKDVLSYDEIKLSAFLSVSSFSEFLNDGSRYNAGQIENDKSQIIESGIIIGLIGGRFERPQVMEWQDVVITPQQNIHENGYGFYEQGNVEKPIKYRIDALIDYRKLWNDFYDERDFLHKELWDAGLDGKRFHKYHKNMIFDAVAMKKRYAISFDTLLLEANARAGSVGRQAYVHVVGIGLGVWKAVSQQVYIFLETFGERIKTLLPQLSHVGVVHFSYFHMKECGDLKDNISLSSDAHPNGGIKIFLSNRNPAGKLPKEYENMLVVVSYAWDANALPGNEFWLGSLCGSGDPAAACSTLISELHNPHINKKMVSGENLYIATLDSGCMHIKDYAAKVFGENSTK